MVIGFLNRVISVISVLLRKTTSVFRIRLISLFLMECEIVKAVSLSTTEITEITRFEKPIFRVGIP